MIYLILVMNMNVKTFVNIINDRPTKCKHLIASTISHCSLEMTDDRSVYKKV